MGNVNNLRSKSLKELNICVDEIIDYESIINYHSNLVSLTLNSFEKIKKKHLKH